VGEGGLLVHNLYIVDAGKFIFAKSYRAAMIAARGVANYRKVAAVLGGFIHGHHIVMKGAFKGMRGKFVRYSQDVLAQVNRMKGC
jgi:hypothetical protein